MGKWDAMLKEQISTLALVSNLGGCVTGSSKGSQNAIGSAEKSVGIWDPHAPLVDLVAWCQKGDQVALLGESTVVILDANLKNELI